MNYNSSNDKNNNEKLEEENAENGNDSKKLMDNVIYRLSLNPNKGGLQKVDKEKVDKIIYDVSKGSAFFKNVKEKEKIHTERIKEMQKKYSILKKQNLEYEKQQMKNLMEKMDKERDLSQYIVHVDMDAFYASVEELDNPELKNKPMAVGSKSMLSTANYEARKYGVRSAMPGYIALKLCKDLTIVPLRHERYHEISLEIRKIISNYDPNYLPASVDEVYLNITNFLNNNPTYTPSKVAEEIRQEIFKKTKLTASAGIAPNLMLAKICSDMNKPNGQTELKNDPNDIKEFLKSLPIGKVSGIGKVAERTLNELGIKTCGELKDNMVYIKELFKPASYQFLLEASLGIGKTIIENKWERKSISVERTFSNISLPQELYNKLFEISCKLAEDVLKENLKGKSVTLKLKTSGFEILTRCLTINKYIFKQEDLYKIGKKLLDSYIDEHPKQSYRLMGLRLSSFLDEKNSLSLDKYVKIIDDKNSVDILTQQKEYECPVCFRMIKVNNLTEFEKHVNFCLNKNENKNEYFDIEIPDSNNNITNSDDNNNNRYNKKLKLNENNNYISKKISNNNIENDNKRKQKIDSYIIEESNNFNICSSNDNKKNSNNCNDNNLAMKPKEIKVRNDNNNYNNNMNEIRCPICNLIILCSSNEELNSHIDICLNKDIINSLETQSKNKSKNKLKNKDNYINDNQ